MNEVRLMILYASGVIGILVLILAGLSASIGQFDQFLHGAEIAGILTVIMLAVGSCLYGFAWLGDWLLDRNRRIEEARHS